MAPIKYDELGREVHEKKPKRLRADFKPPNTLLEDMRMLIRRELSDVARSKGHESFEEANDFDVDDDSPDFTKNAPWEEAYEGQFDEEVKLEKDREDWHKNPPRQPKKESENGNRRKRVSRDRGDDLGQPRKPSTNGTTKDEGSHVRFEDR